MSDRKLILARVEEAAGVPGHLAHFIKHGDEFSLQCIHKVAKVFGAKNLLELYRMGGVIPPLPDNGVGNVVESVIRHGLAQEQAAAKEI